MLLHCLRGDGKAHDKGGDVCVNESAQGTLREGRRRELLANVGKIGAKRTEGRQKKLQGMSERKGVRGKWGHDNRGGHFFHLGKFHLVPAGGGR